MSVLEKIQKHEQQIEDLKSRAEREPEKAANLWEMIDDLIERIANLREDLRVREEA